VANSKMQLHEDFDYMCQAMVPKTVCKIPQTIGKVGLADNPTQDLASHLALLCQKSPDLGRVIEAWPTLPDHIRKAILALVETVN